MAPETVKVGLGLGGDDGEVFDAHPESRLVGRCHDPAHPAHGGYRRERPQDVVAHLARVGFSPAAAQAAVAEAESRRDEVGQLGPNAKVGFSLLSEAWGIARVTAMDGRRGSARVPPTPAYGYDLRGVERRGGQYPLHVMEREMMGRLRHGHQGVTAVQIRYADSYTGWGEDLGVLGGFWSACESGDLEEVRASMRSMADSGWLSSMVNRAAPVSGSTALHLAAR
eukprot:COSAG01_NODE_7964_length_2974_cov_2.305739_2_plen_225_part_00